MRYFLPRSFTLTATSDMDQFNICGNSIFEPVVEVFQNFVLEADDAALVLPPGVAQIVRRIERRHQDRRVVAEDMVQRPAQAAGGEDIRRHDDAAGAVAGGALVR